MKKTIGLIAVLVLLFVQSKEQNIFYDAQALRQDLNAGGKFDTAKYKEIAAILKNYLPSSFRDNATLTSQVLSFYAKNNLFIAPLIDPNDLANTLQSAKQFSSFSSFISKAGALDVTNFADGLAKFLVERAKEELSLAFFQQLKEDMASERFKELRTLFPQTYTTLNLIDQRIYQYAAYLTELREAFIIDLKDLGYNIPTVLRSDGKLGKYFTEHPSFRTAVSLAGQITELYLRKDELTHAGNVIDALDPDHYFGSDSISDVVMNGSIKLMQLVSGSLRSGDTTRYWVPRDSLAAFFSDPVTVRLYLGLVYTRSDGIRFGPGKSFKGMLDSLAVHFDDRVRPFSGAIAGFAQAISAYDDYWKYKRDGKNADSTALHYYSMYIKTINAIDSGLKLVVVFKPDFSPGFIAYLPAMRDLGDVYIDAKQRKFSLAILSFVHFLDHLQDAGLDSKFLQKFSTYGAFIAEVGQAENSDQVKDIIAKTVLPVGSSSIKKNSRFNIALNAYVGGFFGNEYLPDNGIKHWAQTAGVTAPVGISFSKPLIFNNGKCKLGSISAFVSLLDIGAIASFRFKDSSSAQLPKLSLQNIFAPGLGAIWGVPRWPVSIGYMYQWGPSLREITATDAKLNTGSLNRRWFFFAAVDIPLLNIFNKPR